MLRTQLLLVLLLVNGAVIAAPSFSGKGHVEARQQQRIATAEGDNLGQRYEGLLEGQVNSGRLKANTIYWAATAVSTTMPPLMCEMKCAPTLSCVSFTLLGRLIVLKFAQVNNNKHGGVRTTFASLMYGTH